MRIAVVHFIADVVLGAGTAAKSVALSRALAAAGVATRFITTDIGLDRRPLPPLPGVEVTVIRSRFSRFPVPQIGRRGMDRLIDGCDAVVLVSHWTALNALAAASARRLGVPYILCPAGALRIQGRSRGLKTFYRFVAGRKLIASAGALVATTPLEAAQFREDGVRADRIHVIPNGIDLEPAGMPASEFRARHSLPDAPLLLYMGRFNPIKGPDLLLEAFGQVAGRFREWQLVMAGRDEGMERDLQERASALGLSGRVHFVGHLDASQSTGAYRAASLLVVPSRYEAMSLVALEAGVVGTPVLLTDACGFDEIQRAGGGRVVPATVTGLADGLDALLADAVNLPAMGERLRDLAVRRYGWPSVIQEYLELVERLRRSGR